MRRGLVGFQPPWCYWKHAFRESFAQRKCLFRPFVTITHDKPPKVDLPRELPTQYWSQLPKRLRPDRGKREIIVYPPLPSIKKTCPDPVRTVQESQLQLLDPSSARTSLFDRSKPEAAKPGDILYVTFRSGEPFSGIFMAHRNRGQDSSILLRNHLTRVGTEMQVKIYSPNVTGIEIADRAEKRPRRKRLYYLRLPKHDRGEVSGIVLRYLRAKQNLASGGQGRAFTGGRTTRKKKAR